RFRYAIGDVANVFLSGPKRDVHDQSMPLGDHCRRGKLAGVVMRSDACGEHRVPTRDSLLPEWFWPGENATLYHVLVAAPHVIDQDIDWSRLPGNLFERRAHLCIVSMVTANASNPFFKRFALHK